MKRVSVQVVDFGLFPFVNLQFLLEYSANVLEWTEPQLRFYQISKKANSTSMHDKYSGQPTTVS